MSSGTAILVAPFAATLVNARVGTTQDGGRTSSLRVGASKVDVTPTESELPKNYLGVLDRVYARAIVLDSGATRAALITVDAGMIPDGIWQTVTRQIETELQIASTNVLLTATHTHGVPAPPPADYARKTVDAARVAQQKLVPARVGYGTGESYINVNRQITDPKTGKWWEGPNRSGYIPDDASYGKYTFEVLSSRLKPGCAESSIVNGLLDLIDSARNAR